MNGQVVLIVIALVGVVAYWSWAHRRADEILHRWAGRNGYRIEWAERRTAWRGPYFLTSDRSRVVFRVSVDVGEGRSRLGYVRCGALLLSVLCDSADVRWDREPRERRGFPVALR